MRPYLAAAGALAFVSGLGNFGIPALLGLPVNYQTLTTLIYQRLSSFGPSVLPEVAALATLIGGLALVGVLAQALALRGAGHRLSAGARVSFALGRRRMPLAAAAWGVLVVILVLPAIALVSTSLVPAFGVPLTAATVTLDNYLEVLTRQAATLRAFSNSTLLAGSAALILAVAAIPTAIVLERLSPAARRLLHAAAELPYAVPGIVLAIACILMFLKPLPLIGSLYATAGIILVAYLMRFVALALKPVAAAVGQIPRDMDEAAAMAGAGPLRRLSGITAPLVAPSALAGGLLVFMGAFNELTVSALLWSAGNETLGVILFNLAEAGLAPQASAVAVATIAVVVAILALVDRSARRLPPGTLPWR